MTQLLKVTIKMSKVAITRNTQGLGARNADNPQQPPNTQHLLLLESVSILDWKH